MACKGQVSNQKKNNKRSRIAPPAAGRVSARAAIAVPSMQPSHSRAANLYEDQGLEYLSASGILAASSAPSTSFLAASNFYSVDAPHNQPASSFTGQGHSAQYSSGHYSFSCSVPDTHAKGLAGSYGLLGSPPVTQHLSLTAEAYGLRRNSITGHYSLGGSDPVATHMNSATVQNGTSIVAGVSSGQFGSSGTSTAMAISSAASPRSNLAYYPGDPLRSSSYNDRPVSSRSGYDMPSKRPASIYHI